MIQDVEVDADQDLNKVSAYQIRHRNPFGHLRFQIGNQIGNISTLDGVDGLNMSAGQLKQFTTGADVFNTDIEISGPINRIDVGGTLRGSSLVEALGPEGTLSTLSTKRGLFADVRATVSIGSILVGSDLGSSNISTVNNLDLLSVGGSIVTGVRVSNVETGQDKPFKKIDSLIVGGDIQSGATIRVKRLNHQKIGGVVNGNIIVG